jgi:hypothetical protein
MAIDQTAFGRVVMKQMEAIERDHGEDAQIAGVCLVVQIQTKDGAGEVRVRMNVPPAYGARLLKEAAEQAGVK